MSVKILEVFKKEALFDENGNRLSEWYDYIRGFAEQKDYFLAKRGSKKTILHKSGEQVVGWFQLINEESGIFRGRSEYFIAYDNGGEAIFHISGEQVSKKFENIEPYGLVRGESPYYIAKNKKGTAIYHLNGTRISDYFFYIFPKGLVSGTSEYYKVQKNFRYNRCTRLKSAIYHRRSGRISDWYDRIFCDDFLDGKSDLYVGIESSLFKDKLYLISKTGEIVHSEEVTHCLHAQYQRSKELIESTKVPIINEAENSIIRTDFSLEERKVERT